VCITALRRQYGSPAPPPTDVLGILVRESVVYLATDERREAAYQELARTVGVTPERMLAASGEALLRVTSMAGIAGARCAEKLREVARIAIGEFDGDVEQILRLPLAKAKRALRLFPGIGEPGADKILLFTGTHPSLAPESNVLRVLTRLGFVQSQKSYTATYRAAQAITEPRLRTCTRLTEAHQLLRHHGQQVCKASAPNCGACSLRARCAYYGTRNPE
jgi:endonuclease-3